MAENNSTKLAPFKEGEVWEPILTRNKTRVCVQAA